jgi:4-hydroxybenzoate polyprenyltransferase
MALLMFFFELRLMDEIKDFEKDKIAHPERPLPRGLLSETEAKKVINALMIVMGILSLFLALALNLYASLLFAFSAFYLWLMFKEFYVGEWLQEHPLFYAISHQVALIPIVAFAVAAFDTDVSISMTTLALGITGLGSFFSYEICRKLDPSAPSILKTYISIYGPERTFTIVATLNALSAVAAYPLGLGKLLWPLEFVVVLGFFVMLFKPRINKVVELLASLSLIIHLWGAAIGHWLRITI